MKREIKIFFLFILLLFPVFLVAQQEIQVGGKVVEAEINESLPGVSILIENSTRGVTTDVDGTFEIKVNPSDKLIFSFMAGQMAGIVSNDEICNFEL